MGFSNARRRLIEALRNGTWEVEFRDAVAEKNLLAVGAVDAAFVIRLLHRCHGADYDTRPHDFDPNTPVHVFRPTLGHERWYVKAYFLAETAVFISVHGSE